MAVEEAAGAADELGSLLAAIDACGPIAGSRRVTDRHVLGAANLAGYLVLRSHELRPLQVRLARLGVSSLGRAEPHVRATVEAARRACEALAGRPPASIDTSGFDDGLARLAANATALLGPPPAGRRVRILVTLPSSAATDGGALVGRLVAAGMDGARVNTAHDTPAAWRSMAAHVRAAAEAAQRPVNVFADLGGPKLRTGPLAPGPSVVRIKVAKDEMGRPARPGRALLVRSGPQRPPDDLPEGLVTVPVDGEFVSGLAPGDRVEVTDPRGRRRALHVVAARRDHALVEVDRTIWLASGAHLRCLRPGEGPALSGRVGPLPPAPRALRLHEGDTLMLTADLTPAVPSDLGAPARIGCTLPQVFEAVRPGHRIEFDDGAIDGEVVAVDATRAEVRITRAPPRGANLRGEKGINLPDTELPVDALTGEDRAALDTVVEVADAVGLSFVRRPDDVAALVDEIDRRRAGDLGIVLKIETPAAFANLPELLVAAMVRDRVGVMIARGDLAVEAGYERSTELQEEILWACEAAHLPVIWATQVLENLAKTGRPTRAELTDAAAATRAECVMLNKGPYIETAVRVLDDILRRMADHQSKKVSLLRKLRSWNPEPP